MNEQPDLFPEDAEESKKRKETDVMSKLKRRHKSTQFIRDLRKMARALKDKSSAEPHDPDSIIVNPKYK